jgi:shikimate kinase
MYKEVLFALGGNVALLAAVSWLIKSILTHYLSKDIETYKQTLKAASDKALIEHDVVFRRLHAERAKIIANFYSQLVETVNCINKVNSILQDQKNRGVALEISAEEFDHLIKYWKPCWDYFSKNKLYFSLELSNKIGSLLIHFMTVAMLASVTKKQDLSFLPLDIEEAMQNLDKATIPELTSKLVSDINKTVKEIENTFRTIVGITR